MAFDFTRRGFLSAAATAPWLVAAPGAPAPAAMRTLGRTGLKVNPVGFGCMITSDPTVIERAIDLGVNHFDTARVYQRGNNERMVGAALKGKRDKVVLSTKSTAGDKAGALAHLEQSLTELQTDHVDIWYLHAKNSPAQITPDLLEAQAQAKKQGKIRFAGVSTHSGQAELIPALIKTNAVDVVLTTYNFASAPQMEPVVKTLHDANIGCIAMKVMAGSLKADPSYDYEKAKEAMKQQGAPLAALKFVLRAPFVHTTIPSIRDNDQLDDNLRALREPYQPADSKLLTAWLERISPLYCRTCGACKGVCPQGLPVSDMLRYLTYADGYGEFPLARENWMTLDAKAQAVRCGDCGTCAISCPNGVRVQDRLVRLQELMA
jgi:uncharacterized protein